MPGTLTIENYNTSSREEVERIETDVAREILGVFISPDGVWTTQQGKIAATLNEFSAKLKNAQLTKEEVKCALDSMMWKKWNTYTQRQGYQERNGILH